MFYELDAGEPVFSAHLRIKNNTVTLKERIREKGLKQSWVAHKIGVHPITFNAYLNGFRDMPQNVSDKVKELIG